MKIFIDSADVTEIKDVVGMGVVDGVTTNPSLVAKTGKSMQELIPEICELVDGPVSAEVLSTDVEGIVREGTALAGLHSNVVVKVPLIADGIRAVSRLSAAGVRTNVTLCFSAPQALLAAKAGATYISPFIGRIDDIGGDGLSLIEEIVTIYNNYAYETEVLAASIRHPVHLVRCAMIGADVATIPYNVVLQLLKHPLTDTGLAKFMEDAKKIPS